MEIRYYTIDTIGDFVNSPGFAKWKNIPITKHRAISHMHNPRVTFDDKILFVAFEGDEVAGYLGVLGDIIFIEDSPVRIGWLSCFYVDPVYRGKHLAGELFNHVMEAWDNHIFITNMAPETIGFYLRSGLFQEPVYKQGIRCFLRFNLAEILPPKKNIFKKHQPFLKITDRILNTGNEVRLFFLPKFKLPSNLRIDYVDEISPRLEDFVMWMSINEWIKRAKPEWDWIFTYPWLQTGNINEENRRYYFSSVANRFFYKLVEFYDLKNSIVSFMILSVRNEHLTVPYFYCDKENHIKIVARFLVNFMRDQKISMITVFHPDLSKTLRTIWTPFIVKRAIQRPYLFPLGIDVDAVNFQDGDGDAVFT